MSYVGQVFIEVHWTFSSSYVKKINFTLLILWLSTNLGYVWLNALYPVSHRTFSSKDRICLSDSLAILHLILKWPIQREITAVNCDKGNNCVPQLLKSCFINFQSIPFGHISITRLKPCIQSMWKGNYQIWSCAYNQLFHCVCCNFLIVFFVWNIHYVVFVCEIFIMFL